VSDRPPKSGRSAFGTLRPGVRIPPSRPGQRGCDPRTVVFTALSWAHCGRCGPGGFPSPVSGNARNPLWRWAEVEARFASYEHREIETELPAVVGAINGAIEARRNLHAQTSFDLAANLEALISTRSTTTWAVRASSVVGGNYAESASLDGRFYVFLGASSHIGFTGLGQPIDRRGPGRSIKRRRRGWGPR
jgi:hypothetical protein